MLPGISGSLITSTFLEQVLLQEFVFTPEYRRLLGQLHRWWRHVDGTLGPASSLRAIADRGGIPLFRMLGYQLIELEPHGHELRGALTRDAATRVALSVGAWSGNLRRSWRATVQTGRTLDASWGFIYSGGTLRIVDARRTYARRTLDFDLGATLADERSALAFISLVRAAGARESTLERMVQQSEAHGVAVCTSLGDGVLEALTALATALDGGWRRHRRDPSHEAAFEQAVTIVYRLLFLLFAEARAMVPTWHHLYRESYTIDGLCRRLATSRAPRGLWAALQAISRLAHSGCRAGDLIVTPFNGRLFSPRHTPLAERARVPDVVVGKAVMALATTPGRSGRDRIAYADLDVEQLGAVYERVLEYEPQRGHEGLRLTRTSHERKSTGTFYTPRPMTDFLVRRALQPLVSGKSAAEILRLRVLDPAMGSGAFLVSACRFLGDAVSRQLALEAAKPHADTPQQRAAARRIVAQRCLYGVDRNPMAVQLSRLSLWLCTLSSDRPLTFLDHRLATGDSLVGASFVNLARPPGVRRHKPQLGTSGQLPLDFDAHHLAASVLPERFGLAMSPEDTPLQVREKERVLARLSATGTPLDNWKRAADLWCAAWFWGDQALSAGIYNDVAGALLGGAGLLRVDQMADVVARAASLGRTHRFFHWELEFPEIFFTEAGHRDPDGGFDVVIGNPPWDVLRIDNGDQQAREHSRRAHGARLRFLRDAGVFKYQSGGHSNSYQLFLERALQLTRPGGRLAMILPSGLATDQGSAALRRQLLQSTSIDRLFGFDNRAGIFPIHRDVTFLLLTATNSGSTDRLTCVFGETDVTRLEDLPDAAAHDPRDARTIVVSRRLIDALDPEHSSLPLLKQLDDLDIVSSVVSTVPRLSAERGWHVAFGRELNATDDRPHFVTRARRDEAELVTIVEGKHLEPFRVLSDTCTLGIPAAGAAALIDPLRTFRRRRIAYRDVASATNRLTLIAAILQPGTLSTHTLFCSKMPLADDAQYCLLALLNSLVANYLVRLQVTTHVTTALMARLPVPRPAPESDEFDTLAAHARALERTGVAGHDIVYAEINAIAARLYGLTDKQYAHVLHTFPLIPQSLRERCLAVYRTG
jgi:Eco57I restriction-modification methylase